MANKETKLKQGIGRQIKEMRLSKGFTQMELAARLGITPSHVWLWETGRTLPDSRYLESICELFVVELRFIQK